MNKIFSTIMGFGRDAESITIYDLEDGTGMMEVLQIPGEMTLSQRLKKALSFIFKKSNLPYVSVYLNEETMEKLRKGF